MNLTELIEQFRSDADDKITPYLWSDEDVTRWLNEAEQEACTRSGLLEDVVTPAICQIPVVAGTVQYSVSPLVIDIMYAEFVPSGETEPIELCQTEAFEMDRTTARGWRRETRHPRAFIHTDVSLRLDCIPQSDGVINLEVRRLPLRPMSISVHRPEIGQIHHRHLVKWALHRAFGVPDAERFDANRSALAYQEFTRHFGLALDANVRRKHGAMRPHHTRASWLG